MSTLFPEGNCETCGVKTRFKCPCHKWGDGSYGVMYFCGSECSAEHRKDHQFMIANTNVNRLPQGPKTGENVSTPQRITLGSFANELPIKRKVGSRGEETSTKATPDQENEGATAATLGDTGKKGEKEKVAQDHTKGVGAKAKRGPLISLSQLKPLQKARKVNAYFKLLKKDLTDLQLYKPRWQFHLKTESSTAKKINKKLMNFTFTRVEDIKSNNLASLVKRRWTSAMLCIKAIEALRPDLIIDLSTDKPTGTGMAKQHQYRSEENRAPIEIIEDPEDKEDDYDMDGGDNGPQEEEEQDDILDEAGLDREDAVDECRICKEVAKEDEVMLFCSSAKKGKKHYGCHTTCMGLIRVGEKLLNEMKSHYRCPDHQE